MDDKRCLGGIPTGLLGQEQSGLAVQLGEEALGGAVEARLRVAGQGDGEVGVDWKSACAWRYAGRLRHQVQRLRGLRISL
jgi:hypothetical protein